jgi:amino acid adenylation domain-containing protein
VFAAATIARLIARFETLLAGIVADPAQRLSRLPLLSAAERAQLLVAWTAPAQPYPAVGLAQRFAAQAQATPAATALLFADATLSYKELLQRVGQLARQLQALGVGPETRVGLCVERSFDLVVGMLGILAAGGAYVPLDPAYPAERLQFMLHDADIAALLTHTALRTSTLAAVTLPDAPVIDLDAIVWDVAAPATLPPSAITVDTLAYIIYTSGSTGTPKGVLVSQRAVSNFVHSCQTAFPVTSADTVLQFASFCFDVSVFEIFTALLSGARLVLAARDTLLSPAALTALLQRHAVSVIDIPPVVLNLLPADAFPQLRIALIGGESFTGALATRWQAPGRRFFNGYGPTEATVTMTLYECQGAYAQTPPIGRAMPNMAVYVLDEQMELLPVGVAGELYIGGVGLARGYWRRPGLTAAKFVPHPWSAEPGARLYATGDLVRWRADGELEFLGRIDGQVKLRGFRVELGEIEAVLSQHPAVREAVVLAREDTPGDKRLVAYVVAGEPRTGALWANHEPTGNKEQENNEMKGQAGAGVADPRPLTTDHLRAFLAKQLPEHMLPAAFVTLDALPLTPSGKVDRRALPAPAPIEPTSVYVAPRNRREQRLCAIWSQYLGRDRIGINDNFFDLGGHSLLGIQIMSAIQQSFKVNLPLKYLFERPTVAELTGAIEQALLSSVSPEELAALQSRVKGTKHV